jgi:hypothetical protein
MPNLDDLAGRLESIHRHVERMADVVAAHEAQRERVRGDKPIRLPLVRGVASGSALTMGGDTNTAAGQAPVGPDLGLVWAIRHLVIEGMTAGATPDVINILRNGRIIWQLNGNQFAQTWGRGEILLHSGETLQYQSVGTFAATGTIIAHGLAQETPAEMIGKMYA